MTTDRTRRWFLKAGAAAGASAGLGASAFAGLLRPSPAAAAESPDLVAATGPDPFKTATAAVERLGGMSRFVGRGSTVAINANTSFKLPGSNVDPVTLLAVMSMCLAAGAREVWLIKGGTPEYWARTPRSKELADVIAGVQASKGDFRVVEVDGGVALSEAHVDGLVLDSDVLLNVSMVKNHTGTNFTGALKNFMGCCPHQPTNSFCHFGSATPSRDGFYSNVGHLSQCIADLNLIRRPDLCIVDATEYLITNGPAGPGELRRSDTVVAATDPVAIDAYATRFVDRTPAQVNMIGMAAKHGLGEPDLDTLRIEEVSSA